MWKTKPVFHIPTPPTTTADFCQTKRYTNIPLGTKDRSGHDLAMPSGNDTPQVLLEHHLKQLRLPTFLREYDKVARQCAAEGVDYPRFLLRLTELELLDRERRATERRIQQARFPVVKDPGHLRAFRHPIA